MDFNQLFRRSIVLAAGVLVAAHTSSGIHYDGWGALFVVVLLLSLVNSFLRPLLMLLSLPLIVLTLGIGIWLVNAFLFLIVSLLVSGFHVESFGSALWGAFVMSLIGVGASCLGFGVNERPKVQFNMNTGSSHAGAASHTSAKRRSMLEDDDVIDI